MLRTRRPEPPAGSARVFTWTFRPSAVTRSMSLADVGANWPPYTRSGRCSPSSPTRLSVRASPASRRSRTVAVASARPRRIGRAVLEDPPKPKPKPRSRHQRNEDCRRFDLRALAPSVPWSCASVPACLPDPALIDTTSSRPPGHSVRTRNLKLGGSGSKTFHNRPWPSDPRLLPAKKRGGSGTCNSSATP